MCIGKALTGPAAGLTTPCSGRGASHIHLQEVRSLIGFTPHSSQQPPDAARSNMLCMPYALNLKGPTRCRFKLGTKEPRNIDLLEPPV